MHRRHSIRNALAGAAAVGLMAAPVALGAPLEGAERNPGASTSSDFSRETQIIGDIAENQGGQAAGTGGFVTRQSNKSSSGGGAIYGCRARAGTEACVAANNLADGHAFRFQAGESAATIGQLRFGVDINKTVDKPPFATNGTGLVRNLNADRVDGKSADEFVEKGSLMFAAVNADGTIAANRGVPAGGRATSADDGGDRVFQVPFTGDLSACVATANPTTATAQTVSPLVVRVATPNNSTVTVIEQGAAGNPYPFSLQVTC